MPACLAGQLQSTGTITGLVSLFERRDLMQKRCWFATMPSTLVYTRYLTETTVGGEYDKRSGTLYDFVAFRKAIEESLKPWQNRHLDLETNDFRDVPSTGENIVRALWPKIDNRVNQQLVRLRLWETANNRFTLRRT